MPETNGAGDTGIDIDATVDQFAEEMGLHSEPEQPVEEPVDEPVEPVGEPPAKEPTTDPTQPPAAKAMPKSWSKDKAELWSKLPPDAQNYYEQREKQFLDGIEQYKGAAQFAHAIDQAISPYRAQIAAMGVSEVDAVKFLLNADYRLRNGTMESRLATLKELAGNLGLPLEGAVGEAQQELDPALKSLLARLERVESTEAERQRRTEQEIRSSTQQEVETFWADPKNIYVDEVGYDMVPLVTHGMDIAEAYKRAVWGNPVTREKELARIQTEAKARLIEDAKKEGTAARNATRLNVRGTETRRAPTEPKGTMEDTMRATLKEIKARG